MRRFRGVPPLVFGFLAVFAAVPIFYLGRAQQAAFFSVVTVVLVVSGGFLMASGLHDRSALLIKDKDDRERALAEGSRLSRTALIVFMVGGLVAVLVGF